MTNGHESSAQLKQLEAENQELRRQLESKNRECGDQANANLRYEQAVVWVLKICFCTCCLISKPFNIYSFFSAAQQWESEAKRFKNWAEQWQSYQIAQLPDPNAAVFQQLQSQLNDTEQQLQYGWQCFEQQRTTLEAASSKVQQLTHELEDANRQLQLSSSKELVTKIEFKSIYFPILVIDQKRIEHFETWIRRHSNFIGRTGRKDFQL